MHLWLLLLLWGGGEGRGFGGVGDVNVGSRVPRLGWSLRDGFEMML